MVGRPANDLFRLSKASNGSKMGGMRAVFLILVLTMSVRPLSGAGTETHAVTAVVRAFLAAAMTMDVTEVKRHALPHPEIAILGEGQPPPPPVKRHMRATFATATCRFLKVGEIFTLPGGRRLTVSKEAVAAGRCLVVPLVGGDPMPIPLAVIRTDAGWKVDATPLVAARVAAKGGGAAVRKEE